MASFVQALETTEWYPPMDQELFEKDVNNIVGPRAKSRSIYHD
jgi:hypothetical protein